MIYSTLEDKMRGNDYTPGMINVIFLTLQIYFDNFFTVKHVFAAKKYVGLP
jgi:hypothetical protein